MRRSPAVYLLLIFLVTQTPFTAHAESGELPMEAVLDFELPAVEGVPGGWGGGPAATLGVDHVVFWSGRAAGRIERVPDSEGEFSTFTQHIPVDFDGSSIRYSGYLRSESVEDWAGLWMRVDGPNGVLAFDNMQARPVKGDSGWHRYEINLGLPEGAEDINFGALLSGPGSLWVDGLSIEIDGVPLGEVPRRGVVPTMLDMDHEFDAGSGIEIGELGPDQVERLARLGRVWGFLKYHHPTAVQGKRHWDYELFRVMPRILEADSDPECRAILEEWVAGLGEIEPCRDCAEEAQDLQHQVDLSWLRDETELGATLAATLDEIHRQRPWLDEQFYVRWMPNVGNPAFRNEPAYEDMELPDTGYRLLALLRWWNIIEYWFPYRDLIEEDWYGVLREFVPRLVEAVDGDAYRREMMQLIARAHDTHANLWSDLDLRPPTGECDVPVQLRFLEDRWVVSRFDDRGTRARDGLELGDAVLAIDEQTVEERVDAYWPYYAGSNRAVRLRAVGRQLLRGDCGPVDLRILRGEEELLITLERAGGGEGIPRWHDRPGDGFQMLGEDVAYLKFSSAEAAQVPSYLERAKGTTGWVLDLRNYPSEFLVFALGQHLVAESTDFVRFTHAAPDTPGAFSFSEPYQLEPMDPHYGGKVVILVDEATQSSAEYTSMAFAAAPGAVVIGSTTAAADGNVSKIPLPGGLSTMISGIGVFYPDGRGTQRVGIALDQELVPTVEGIREGRDELLEAGLRHILGRELTEEELHQRLYAAQGQGLVD